MNYFLIALVSLVSAIVFLILSFVYASKDFYLDATNEMSCSAGKLNQNEKTCGIWDPNSKLCEKGTCVDCGNSPGKCTSKKDYVPFIMFMMSITGFIICIITTVVGLVKLSIPVGSKSRFSYHSIGMESSNSSSLD